MVTKIRDFAAAVAFVLFVAILAVLAFVFLSLGIVVMSAVTTVLRLVNGARSVVCYLHNETTSVCEAIGATFEGPGP